MAWITCDNRCGTNTLINAGSECWPNIFSFFYSSELTLSYVHEKKDHEKWLPFKNY